MAGWRVISAILSIPSNKLQRRLEAKADGHSRSCLNSTSTTAVRVAAHIDSQLVTFECASVREIAASSCRNQLAA
jgi:hypothetical protein